MTTTLSEKGEIVLPASVRARHELRTGEVLTIEDRETEVVLKKANVKRKKTLAQLLRECPGEILVDRFMSPAGAKPLQ